MAVVVDDILTLAPPPADVRLPYGGDAHQFGDLRIPGGLPKPGAKSHSRHPVVMNIHGGYWRNQYDLAHAGHLCAALTAQGFATWNIEYRRIGDPGGGWPGSFEDVRNSHRFLHQIAKPYNLDLDRVVVMGHSAGGQLALALAGHETSVKNVVSLAGVVDLARALELHLSHDAVADFLGGTPLQVPEHYHEADPMQLKIPLARQVLIHGLDDDVVPIEIGRRYRDAKLKQNENVQLIEVEKCGHFELIDPRSAAWAKVVVAVKLLTS